MTQRIQNADLAREGQFTMMKDSVRRLIYALEAASQGSYSSGKSLLGLFLASGAPRPDPYSAMRAPPPPGGALGGLSEAGGDLPRIYPVPSVQHLQELSVNLNSLSGEPSRHDARDQPLGALTAASQSGSLIMDSI